MTIFSIIPESMETARIFSILSYFLNDTAVRFLPIVFRIADTDKQDFACIIFKRLRVLPVLNLPYFLLARGSGRNTTSAKPFPDGNSRISL